MPFPRRLLFEGEEIVLDVRPHWRFFVGPALLLLVALAVLVAAAGAKVDDWALLAAAGVVVASLLWFAGRYLRWATTNFVLTTDRLIFRSGVVAKRGTEIPLERINTVFSHQTILERMLRSGDLVIESGGEQGRESFSDIPRPAQVQNEIYRQIEDNQQRSSGAQREPDVVDQLDRLDDLRKRGVITEAEFLAKKTKLLDRL
ncbi:MAG: hypothetical protein JWN29_3274 [Acidimicrobiales bacterium]|nr:hypothetical protein [Acidimicrobiales bacterium]